MSMSRSRASNAELSTARTQKSERSSGAHGDHTMSSAPADPLTRIIGRSRSGSGAGAHAATLNRATASQPVRAGGSLLRLQRQYGNRYVQRVLELARQGEGEVAPEVEESIKQARGGGKALDSGVREQMEPAFDTDFSGVRVHTDSQSDALNRSLNARAFATGQDIFFRQGAYRPGTSSGRELIAHELTHVVQQNGGRQLQSKLTVSQPGDRYEREADQVARAVMLREQQFSPTSANGAVASRQVDEEDERIQNQSEEGQIQAKTAKPAAKAQGDVAPGVIDLKGKNTYGEVPAGVLTWLEGRKNGKFSANVRFGPNTTATLVRMQKTKRKAETRIILAESTAIPLSHPLFAGIGEASAELQPSLVLNKGQQIQGYLGIRAGRSLPKLQGRIKRAPDLIGLAGLQIPKSPNLTNQIQAGELKLAGEVSFQLGKAFKNGKISVEANDEKVTKLEGGVDAEIQGLGSASLKMERKEDGVVRGEGSADLKLTDNFSGKVNVVWDGAVVTGEGTVEYSGEKLSGQVTLRVMEKSKAAELEQQRRAPAEGANGKTPKKSRGKKVQPHDYVIFGEGNLTFEFTDWLNGAAQVIVDPMGEVTIIGKITPQKEVNLFDPPQKDYSKDLFSFQAKAGYGLPVVGRIGIFAKADLDAFAKLGPAKLFDIEVEGEYSTDPKKKNSFQITGTLNISAAAGLRLRAEAGALLEILAHDIKAGAGVNGIAGIRGYAQAKPVIGYREQAAEGEDKKGEFFIRGDMEIAAQPFLQLSGDLFVEVDAPWWSPVPDKKWTWPLGEKTWPIGGSFGIGASVDYVFGSGKAPAVDFKKVDFDGDKFLTDLYSDKAKASGEKAAEKAGQWKEKNSRSAEPPKGEQKGDAEPTKAPAKGAAQPTVKPGGPKKATKPANPNAKTAEGKTVKEYQEEARQKGGKPAGKEPKTGTAKAEPAAKDTGKKSKTLGLATAKNRINDELRRQLPNGASQVAEVNKVLAGVANAVEPALTRLRAEEVMPGRSKTEGSIGFKVKATEAQGRTVLLSSVRYSKGGTALSYEKRWELGVDGVKKAVTKLAKRGISEKTIRAQFPRWRSEFGFESLSLNTERKPWVIEGEMSPGKKVTDVPEESFEDVGKALRTRGRKKTWDAISEHRSEIYRGFVQEILEKAAVAAVFNKDFMETWNKAQTDSSQIKVAGTRFHKIAKDVGEKIYQRRWPHSVNVTAHFELEVAGGNSRIDILIAESSERVIEFDFKTSSSSALDKKNREEMSRHLADIRQEFGNESLELIQESVSWISAVNAAIRKSGP